MRSNEYNVDELFINRWSPRSFDETYHLKDDDLKKIFSAAGWSPSCFNEQPWRFVIAKKGDKNFNKFLNLLVDDNKKWAKNASLLGYIIAKKSFTKQDNPNKHSWFDSGAAWMGLTLQARKLGLYTHAMAGIKEDQINDELKIDNRSYELICGFVLGKIADKENLSDELKKIEKPNARKDLDRILFYGEHNE